MEVENKMDYIVSASQLLSEADVENKVIIPLFRSIGVIKSNSDYALRVPVQMQLGRQSMTKEADIVIYRKGKPFVVIEAKSVEQRITDDCIAQLDSYAWGLSTKFGVACDGGSIVLREYIEGNKKVYLINSKLSVLNTDVLKSYLNESADLKEADINRSLMIQDQSRSFSNLLRQIHQDIRDIDKLDPTNAFDEWSKLLFVKIHEEKWTSDHNGERRLSYAKFMNEKKIENADSYISTLFKNTCNSYPNIFDPTDKIKLSMAAVEKILYKFDGYLINEIPMDVKGKAYEIFLSSTFRGKGLGQFFTPRPVVEFMIELADIELNTVILDPACGTGGFLISAYQKILTNIDKTPDSVFKDWKTTKELFRQSVKDSHIYGVDAEPRATKTAKMNMIMWGDGENVVRGNGLDSVDISGNPYAYLKQNVSLILANPPFGNKETDLQILKGYELYKDKINKTECLFIEKALNTLVPGGELAIVIPDGVLVSKKTEVVRKLIKNNASIKAVISLPKHTFSPSGVSTISTSVLYVKKFCKEYFDEIKYVNNLGCINDIKEKYGYLDYNIFMGVALQIGYEPNGDTTRSRINELDDILRNYKHACSQNMYSNKSFYKISENSFIINAKQLESRIDARYYWFNNLLENRNFEYVQLKDYIVQAGEKCFPKTNSPHDTFSIVSVTNSNGIILDTDDDKKYDVEGVNISDAKIVRTGDIAYNPYRVNVGSIGIVDKDFDGMLISSAYVVFRTKNGLDPKVLCALLKNEFYNTYIDIYGLGTIRTSLSFSMLENLKIPKKLIGEYEDVTNAFSRIDSLKNEIKEVESEMQKKISDLLA